MAEILKRSKQTSSEDLVKALDEFCLLLETQKEDEAIVDLKKAQDLLSESEVGADQHQEGIRIILESFDGEHELSAYTLSSSKDPSAWTEADQLRLASSRVLNLARRMGK